MASVTIVLELDDDTLIPADTALEYIRAAKPLRLTAVKGGVRLYRSGRSMGGVYRCPEQLWGELVRLARRALSRAFAARCEAGPTATAAYWMDCARFFTAAARLVQRDPRIQALWGREPGDIPPKDAAWAA